MHPPSKQIVIAGYFGFGSAIDEAILASLCKVFRSATQPFRLVAISGDSAETAAAYEVEVCDWSDTATISEAVRSAEAVMIAGGSLFTPSAAAVLTAGMATTWPAFSSRRPCRQFITSRFCFMGSALMALSRRTCVKACEQLAGLRC